MTVETEADRLTFLSDFGVIAKVAGVDVLGILDQEFKNIGGIESFYPIFEYRISDAPDIGHGDTVVVEDNTFHVVSLENDREGMQQLILAVVASNKYEPTGGASAYTPTNS